MNCKIILLVLLLTTSFQLLAQVSDGSDGKTINWISVQELEEKSKIEKKKVFVDIFTPWCKWCKKMDREVFQHPYIIQYVNENFYALKINAEQKDEILFKGKKYKFVPSASNAGYHEFAAALMRGQLGYPTVAFLDEDLNIIQSIQGFKDVKLFEAILAYFGQDFHKKMPWVRFLEFYKEEQNRPAIHVKE